MTYMTIGYNRYLLFPNNLLGRCIAVAIQAFWICTLGCSTWHQPPKKLSDCVQLLDTRWFAQVSNKRRPTSNALGPDYRFVLTLTIQKVLDPGVYQVGPTEPVWSTGTGMDIDKRAEKYVGFSLQRIRALSFVLKANLSTNKRKTQGLQWMGESLPIEKYMFAFIPEKNLSQCRVDDPDLEFTWCCLDDASESVACMMRWLYSFYVTGIDNDRRVCCWEQDVFYVLCEKFDPFPGYPWGVQIHVFDVMDQREGVFFFRLAD